jgi:hypothetical protein
MNAALMDVFLGAVLVGVRAAFQQRHFCEPNNVFVDMIEWFAQHYGTTTAEDRDANCQRMAADWHPGDGFDALTLGLFTGAAYANATGYLIVNRDIVNIGIRVIKRCGLYAEEYKSWIARATATPHITETLDTFKTIWADKITLVNQTTIPASSHGYGMVAVNNEDTVASYGESIANFGAAYAATQESVKTQGTTIVALQTQLQAMQQYCMGLQQQPPPYHLSVTAASTGWPWIRPSYPVDRRQRRRRISSPNDNETTINHAPDAIQAFQKLELLPHARWGHCHHPHQSNVPLARSKPQPHGNKDEHTGRLAGEPPQDGPPFGGRTSPTTTATATCTHPSNVATAPAPRHVPRPVPRRDDNNVSDNASGTLPTSHPPRRAATPNHVPRRSASGTTCPLWRNPDPARASTGYNDVPLLCNVPAATSILTVRGKRQQ